MIKGNFRAVYNIFNKKIAVLYGDCISHHIFEEDEEWIKFSFNGNPNHPNYLHTQIDYDECFQLLFYPRKDGDQSLHEDLGTFFNSSKMEEIPGNLMIVYNDEEFEKELSKLQVLSDKEVTVEKGL
jgi:hypothetical protein